jgi:hypothetical protein
MKLPLLPLTIYVAEGDEGIPAPVTTMPTDTVGDVLVTVNPKPNNVPVNDTVFILVIYGGLVIEPPVNTIPTAIVPTTTSVTVRVLPEIIAPAIRAVSCVVAEILFDFPGGVGYPTRILIVLSLAVATG